MEYNMCPWFAPSPPSPTQSDEEENIKRSIRKQHGRYPKSSLKALEQKDGETEEALREKCNTHCAPSYFSAVTHGQIQAHRARMEKLERDFSRKLSLQSGPNVAEIK